MASCVWIVFLQHRSAKQLQVVAALMCCSRALRSAICELCTGTIIIDDEALLSCKRLNRPDNDKYMQQLQDWCIEHGRLLLCMDLRSSSSKQQESLGAATPALPSRRQSLAAQLRPVMTVMSLAAEAAGGLLLQELHTDTHLSPEHLQLLPSATLTSLSFNYSRSIDCCWEESIKAEQAAALQGLTGLRELNLRGDSFSSAEVPCLTALSRLSVLKLERGHSYDVELHAINNQQHRQLVVQR